MMHPDDFTNFITEITIVVDNARRPTHSATEAAAQYPLLFRNQKQHVRERRMLRKRSPRSSSRWESAPVTLKATECKLQDQNTQSSCLIYQTAMNLVNLTGAMPLRMPIRSKDEFDLQHSCLSISSDDQSNLIDFLDEALAISEILDIK